ncbi:hypothetical protein Hanom_Chr08g00751641 [Helianthus anomalus]
MGFQTLWGMKLIKRFDVIVERFKTHGGLIWVPQDLPEQFDPVYPPSDAAAVVQDHPVDLDGPAMPQPPPPPGAPQFPQHVIPGHALGATADPRLRADGDRLMDLVGWLVREAQDR